MWRTLFRKSPPGQRWEFPNIPGLPTIRMRRPYLAILGNGMPQALLTLIGLPDYVKRGIGLLREPQYWLVVARRSIEVSRKTIFVIQMICLLYSRPKSYMWHWRKQALW